LKQFLDAIHIGVALADDGLGFLANGMDVSVVEQVVLDLPFKISPVAPFVHWQFAGEFRNPAGDDS
jgi:hypothetical protein